MGKEPAILLGFFFCMGIQARGADGMMDSVSRTRFCSTGPPIPLVYKNSTNFQDAHRLMLAFPTCLKLGLSLASKFSSLNAEEVEAMKQKGLATAPLFPLRFHG